MKNTTAMADYELRQSAAQRFACTVLLKKDGSFRWKSPAPLPPQRRAPHRGDRLQLHRNH